MLPSQANVYKEVQEREAKLAEANSALDRLTKEKQEADSKVTHLVGRLAARERERTAEAAAAEKRIADLTAEVQQLERRKRARAQEVQDDPRWSRMNGVSKVRLY